MIRFMLTHFDRASGPAKSMMLALFVFAAIIAPLGAPQSLNAQLHNASATGDVQQLANLVAKVRAANPRNYLSQLSNCFEGRPSQCTGGNSPAWCGAYSVFPISGGDQDDCLSVLHTAAKTRQSGSIKFLTGVAGMDVDVLDMANQTALHTAFDSFTVYWHPCTSALRKTVLALLAAGANPNLPFHYGNLQNYTVLHFEANDGNRHGLLADLVRAGADVNARDDRGYTPLHSAAQCDFRLSCDDCGCSTGSCTNDSKDATCLTDLKNYPKNATVQFFGAAPTLKYLVAQGGNPNAKANDGTKPISLVTTPSGNLADPANWISGTCEKTYNYLKSVSA